MSLAEVAIVMMLAAIVVDFACIILIVWKCRL